MFTGLVQQIGTVREVRRSAGGSSLRLASTFSSLVLGESIAVNGCCLTVTAIFGDGFSADASHETLERTTTGALAAGHRVHLERALALGERLGGHLVSGHVDGIGRLVERSPLGDALRVTFDLPELLAPFIAPKGSVALDGVSLTVNRVRGARFDVALVPFTQGETLLAARPIGSAINVEVDVLAKYVARLLGRGGVDGVHGVDGEGALSPASGLTLDALIRAGFAKLPKNS